MLAKVILFCAYVALATCAVRREAPAASPLQELEKHAAEFQKTFTEQLNALSNSKSTQDLTKTFKEGSESVLQQLSALSTNLQKALVDANGKAKEAVAATSANIDKTVKELRAAHPEVEQQATALRQRLEAAVQQGVAQSQALAKELAANAEQTGAKLQPKIKEAYDDFVKHAEQVQKKLHEAATKQ